MTEFKSLTDILKLKEPKWSYGHFVFVRKIFLHKINNSNNLTEKTYKKAKLRI
jgi:hypothetical protein